MEAYRGSDEGGSSGTHLCVIGGQRGSDEGGHMTQGVRWGGHLTPTWGWGEKQPLFHYGDQGLRFFIVMKGSVNIYVPRNDKEIHDEINAKKKEAIDRLLWDSKTELQKQQQRKR